MLVPIDRVDEAVKLLKTRASYGKQIESPKQESENLESIAEPQIVRQPSAQRDDLYKAIEDERESFYHKLAIR